MPKPLFSQKASFPVRQKIDRIPARKEQDYKMIKKIKVRKISKTIATAANNVLERYEKDLIADEEDFTSQMLGAIQQEVNSFEDEEIRWTAKTLKHRRGKAAEEKKIGADFLGVLDIDIPGYKVKKGFLAQAKRAEPDEPLSKDQWERLCVQCRKMLKISPASFVIVYSKKKGIILVPAEVILRTQNTELFKVHAKKMQRFFENHIQCFIGDTSINDININPLKLQKGGYDALELKARNQHT
jgi:hypothetical protein